MKIHIFILAVVVLQIVLPDFPSPESQSEQPSPEQQLQYQSFQIPSLFDTTNSINFQLEFQLPQKAKENKGIAMLSLELFENIIDMGVPGVTQFKDTVKALKASYKLLEQASSWGSKSTAETKKAQGDVIRYDLTQQAEQILEENQKKALKEMIMKFHGEIEGFKENLGDCEEDALPKDCTQRVLHFMDLQLNGLKKSILLFEEFSWRKFAYWTFPYACELTSVHIWVRNQYLFLTQHDFASPSQILKRPQATKLVQEYRLLLRILKEQALLYAFDNVEFTVKTQPLSTHLTDNLMGIKQNQKINLSQPNSALESHWNYLIKLFHYLSTSYDHAITKTLSDFLPGFTNEATDIEITDFPCFTHTNQKPFQHCSRILHHEYSSPTNSSSISSLISGKNILITFKDFQEEASIE